MTSAAHINIPIAEVTADRNASTPRYTWRPLQWLNIHRLVICLMLGSFILFQEGKAYIGATSPELALKTITAYFAFAILSELTILWRKPSFNLQVHSQVFADIVFITLLMHTSGGIESGLGMLIIIGIAGGAIIVPGRNANLFASVASLAILFEQVYANFTNAALTNYPQAGMLGASFFATAMLAYVLASRVRASEALAFQRGIDLENMALLNERIIQQMDAGVIVVDHHQSVRLANAAAARMLTKNPLISGQKLINISQVLCESLETWGRQSDNRPEPFQAPRTGIEILPTFIALGSHENSGTIIMLEDISATLHHAQQMKLASLGRLAASIAHEIRNPLGAISHAGQLLSESPKLVPEDVRLTQIIRDHTLRVNTIIENILQLSRKESSMPQNIRLHEWLQNFLQEISANKLADGKAVVLDVQPEDIHIIMDPTQLHQVMTNLIDNGLRYCRRDRYPWLKLVVRRSEDSNTPYLDVIDNGPGIPAHEITHVFEPFFTTENNGTGLGLYLSKELCTINKARMGYFITGAGDSCFRIYFHTTQEPTQS